MENMKRIDKIIEEKGLNITFPCNKRGLCGKCKVIVKGDVSTITDKELSFLSLEEREKGVRLACMAYGVDDNIDIYPYSEEDSFNILTINKLDNINIEDSEYKYGISVDIGTTSVAISLFELTNLTPLKCISFLNPQKIYGADVISRIESSLKGKGETLSLLIKNKIKDAIDSFNIKDEKYKIVITGNTTMLHLLLNKDVTNLSVYPFYTDELFGEYIKDNLYIPRCISGYVGADITMSILASGMSRLDKSILVDIGTNGEMALYNENKFVCCSTAAGPCFEGASLDCGIGAVDGAIDKVYIEDGKIKYHTINNKKPIGICGSGVLDIVSVLVNMEIIDSSGAFNEVDKYVFDNSDVFISQKDIRTIQLAKSSICSGIMTLIKESNLETKDINAVYIAGGFGSYISYDSACNIGLVPKELKDKIKLIGNGALIGAGMLLFNKEYIKQSLEITNKASAIPLETNKYFMEKYIDNMMLEEV